MELAIEFIGSFLLLPQILHSFFDWDPSLLSLVQLHLLEGGEEREREERGRERGGKEKVGEMSGTGREEGGGRREEREERGRKWERRQEQAGRRRRGEGRRGS